MRSIFLVVITITVVLFVASLLKIFVSRNKKTKTETDNFDLDAVFETNKTIWQHSIQKVVTVPHYQYQEAFDVFPYFSDYQESNNFLRSHGASNQRQTQFQNNMQQHEGEAFQFWREQQQKILRSFDATGLGISPELVNFFLNYYNFFLEAFRNNVITFLVNQILVIEVAQALQERPPQMGPTISYEQSITNSKMNFFAHYESDVDQIIQTLYDDINNQYSSFSHHQNMDYEEQDQRTYQERFYQNELDEVNRAYRMLEATEIMDDEEIKKNYRRLAKQYHPDRNVSEEAKVKMAQINAAYDLIKKIRNL